MAAHPPEPAINFDIFEILLRRIWLIVGCAVFGLLLAIVYQFLTPAEFYTDAEILVEYRNSTLPARGSEADNDAVHVDYQELLATHVEIATSERVAVAAVKRHSLDKLTSVREALEDKQTAVDYIHQQLTGYAGGGKNTTDSRLITIGFKHSHAADAATVLKAVVAEYQAFLKNELGEGIAEAQSLITQANVDLEKQLQTQEQKYIEFRAKTPVFYDQNSLFNRHVKNLASLAEEIAQVNIEIAQSESRVALLESINQELASGGLSDLDALSLLGDEAVGRLSLMLEIDRGSASSEAFQAELPTRSQSANVESETLLQLQLKEKELSQTYGPNAQELRHVRNQIADVREFLEAQKSRLKTIEKEAPKTPREYTQSYLSLLQHDLETLRQRATKLELMAKQEEVKAQSVSTYEVQEETLKAALDRKAELYDVVLKNLEEINLINEFPLYETRLMNLISPGTVVWPKAKFVLPAGLFAGTLLGLCFAFVTELRDSTFHSNHEIEKSLGLPIAATLPRVDRHRGAGASLFMLSGPHSPAAEVMRNLRSTLLHRFPHPKGTVIQIASSSTSEGKSVLAANLALALAQTNRRVLLIDADFRDPTQRQLFSAAQPVFLNAVLRHQKALAEALSKSSVENLDLLLSERDPDLASEVFANGEFEKSLNNLKSKYDVIVVDTPAINQTSDALAISRMVDSVLFSVVPRENRSQETIYGLHQLREFLAPVHYAVVQTIGNTSRNYQARSRVYQTPHWSLTEMTAPPQPQAAVQSRR